MMKITLTAPLDTRACTLYLLPLLCTSLPSSPSARRPLRRRGCRRPLCHVDNPLPPYLHLLTDIVARRRSNLNARRQASDFTVTFYNYVDGVGGVERFGGGGGVAYVGQDIYY
uniref:Uncharacterized protein n=1 Tax=Daucus carota subsp. sativus TaxID=79200 RepID=A0A161WUH9_DAUCS